MGEAPPPYRRGGVPELHRRPMHGAQPCCPLRGDGRGTMSLGGKLNPFHGEEGFTNINHCEVLCRFGLFSTL